MTSVDFRLREPDPMVRLEWGITRVRPDYGWALVLRDRRAGVPRQGALAGNVLQRAPASPVAAPQPRGASCW